VPSNGEVASDPVVLFSWLPARSSDGSPARYGFSIHNPASGELRREVETDQLWAAERFAADGEWEARVWLVGSAPEVGDAVVFRTEGVATPRMIAPASESVHPPGQVMLGWTSLSRVESYEYFVAVAGRPEAAVRGISRSTAVSVDLPAVAGRPTLYVATVRACLEPAGCRIGSEAGWGPWASATGVGEVHFTVATGGTAVDGSR